MRALMLHLGLVMRQATSASSLWAYAAALLLTALLVLSGADAAVNLLAQRQPEGVSLAWSVAPLLGGMIAPALVPTVLFFSQGATPLARGVSQAVALSFASNNLLKAITGRTHPEATLPTDLIERSQSFELGFLEAGVLEGWPSGHAMTNVAMGVALVMLCRESWQQRLAALWAAWVSVAVVLGVRGEVHWLSDAVAGALMGGALGMAAGHVHRASTTTNDEAPGELSTRRERKSA